MHLHKLTTDDLIRIEKVTDAGESSVLYYIENGVVLHRACLVIDEVVRLGRIGFLKTYMGSVSIMTALGYDVTDEELETLKLIRQL